MEAQRLIGQAMCTDDHRGRYVGRLKDTSPLRNQLAITSEHDGLGRLRRDIHSDFPATVVLKLLGDEVSCDRHCRLIRERDFASTENVGRAILCRPPGDRYWLARLKLLLQIQAASGKNMGWESLEAPSALARVGARHVHNQHYVGIDDPQFHDHTSENLLFRRVVILRKRMMRYCRKGDRQYQSQQPESHRSLQSVSRRGYEAYRYE